MNFIEEQKELQQDKDNNKEHKSKELIYSVINTKTLLNLDTEESNNYCVYKHTNPINGKVYYGISESYLFRWNDGFGYENNSSFFFDIVKYGWQNFKHEILFSGLTKETAVFLEGLLIQETQSFSSENGYNNNFKSAVFDEINENDNECENGFEKQKKSRGRKTPIVYEEKYYSSVAQFVEETGYDYMLIIQGLNPNCIRKLPKELREKGLRYATEEEIAAENFIPDAP